MNATEATLSAAIKAKLETITDIINVYEFDNVETDGDFPTANITFDNFEVEYEDTSNNQTAFTFEISIYVPTMPPETWGLQKAERVSREISTQIREVFRNDSTLSGACIDCKCQSAQGAYVPLSGGLARAINYKIVCRDLIALT